MKKILFFILLLIGVLMINTPAEAKKKFKKSDLRLMSAIIYSEANGECYAGKKAVGIVVMNRVKHKDFPDSIKGVIYERGQFTPAHNGGLNQSLRIYDQYNKKGKFKGPMKDCRKAALEVLKGSRTIKINKKTKKMTGFLYFSRYIRRCRFQLGGHQFA